MTPVSGRRAGIETRLTRDVLDAIRAHGAETFPHECCGALIAVNGVVVEAFRLPNTTSEGPRRRFQVAADDYRRAEARATDRHGTLLGFYHSHPDHPARPSATDLANAWPNFSYVIISVNSGVPGDITVWHLEDDRSAFAEGDLTCPPVS